MNHVVKAAAIWFGPVPPMPRLAVGDPADSSAELEKFMALLQCDEMGKVKKQKQECFPSLQMINCRVIAVFKRPKSIASLRGTAEQGPPKPKPWLAEQSIRASPERHDFGNITLELVAPGTTFPAPQHATSEHIRTSRGAQGPEGWEKRAPVTIAAGFPSGPIRPPHFSWVGEKGNFCAVVARGWKVKNSPANLAGKPESSEAPLRSGPCRPNWDMLALPAGINQFHPKRDFSNGVKY
jgi:hypothetical protein